MVPLGHESLSTTPRIHGYISSAPNHGLSHLTCSQAGKKLWYSEKSEGASSDGFLRDVYHAGIPGLQDTCPLETRLFNPTVCGSTWGLVCFLKQLASKIPHNRENFGVKVKTVPIAIVPQIPKAGLSLVTLLSTRWYVDWALHVNTGTNTLSPYKLVIQP